MPLSADTIATIDTLLSRVDLSDNVRGAISVLRPNLPGIALLACDASDVLEAPFRSYAGVDLHLVDTSDHCVNVTDDPERATGLLFAARAVTA